MATKAFQKIYTKITQITGSLSNLSNLGIYLFKSFSKDIYQDYSDY